MDWNDQFFFMAFGTSAGICCREVRPRSLYFYTPCGSNSAYLDGTKAYKLTAPGPVPKKLLWSVTVCASETRTIIDTDLGRGAVRTMFKDPQPNEDGSYDIFFGQNAPSRERKSAGQDEPGQRLVHFPAYLRPTRTHF
ncbi:DUF1214 domain-containing protein [Ruegeria litorea]|nr:DUF1214 domain-containing protein [Falsiruegeria litorea]